LETAHKIPSVRHDQADIFTTSPDRIDPDKNVIATYYVDVVEPLTIDEAGVTIAAEQSIGTWTDVVTANQWIVDNLAAKVFEWRYEDGKHSGILKVAYPTLLIDYETGGFPNLLAILAGNFMGFTPIRSSKLLDVQLPKEVVRSFSGPKFGIEGLRAFLGTTQDRRPHLGTTAKPKVGLTADEVAEAFAEASLGGIDTCKDDETMLNQKFSPLLERVSKVTEALDRVKSQTGKQVIYFPQVTTETHKIRELADKLISHGAKGLMVNFMAAGFSALRALSDDQSVRVPLHAHRAMHAAITRNPRHGISIKVISLLARLAGADLLHVGTALGKLGGKEKFTEIPDIVAAIKGPLEHVKPTFPVASGGLHPGILPQNVALIGRDVQLQLGGGIHGHPAGTRAGALAGRQAIEAIIRNISLEEYAETHAELKVALEHWGEQYTKADVFTALPD